MSNQERLPLSVAVRFSRYLQVLTQAKKMGKLKISSKELSLYTQINATQIRRDLSGFGRFGTRGVGYDIDGLRAELRSILRTVGHYEIILIGAGRLGRAIASSEIFADHGFEIVAAFDNDPTVVGAEIGSLAVRDIGELQQVVGSHQVIIAVLAVPAHVAQPLADLLVAAGIRIIFSYADVLLNVPPDVTVHTSSPAADLLHALYFYLS